METNDQSFEDYRTLIYHVLKKLRIPEPYDDHIQEAYFVYEKSIYKYDPSKSKFSTFFTHELHYHYQTLLRKQQRYEKVKKKYHTYNQTSRISDDTIKEQTMMYDLSHHCHLTNIEWDVLNLSYQGYTVNEMALLKELSVSTVKRIRKKIKQKVPRPIV